MTMTEQQTPQLYRWDVDGEERWYFGEQEDQFEFFRFLHAISPEVWAGRPYVPYTTDDPGPVREAFQGFAPNQCKWAENTAKKCDGFLMIQHAVPGLGLLDIPPQLRPYDPILKGTDWHYHPSDAPPDGFVPVKPDGTPLEEKYCSRAWAQRPHILRDKDEDDHKGAKVAAGLGYDTPEKLRELVNDPANAGDLERVLREANNEDVHSHEDWAKYLLTITAKKPWVHDHADYRRPEARDKHVRSRYHGGTDVVGPHLHPEREIKDDDPRKSSGKRIDVHPLAWERFANAELIFFELEGKIKADARLSAIIRLDLPQSVCSVPSIGQWDAYELDEFARRDLAGKLVVIVVDADGGDNPDVMTQALLLRSRLREPALGVRAAAIFAPPYAAYKATPQFKGDDDNLGIAGGSWDNLEMLGCKVPARPLVEWATERRQTIVNGKRVRWDGVGRDLRTLMGLSLLLGPGGQGQPSLKRVARFIGVGEDSVERALKSLIKLGVVETDRPIATARWQWKSNTPIYRDPNLGFVDRPTIKVIHSALRARDLPTERLSDWIERQPLSAVWEESSMTIEERVDTIEAALAQLGLAVAPKKKNADDQIEVAAAQLERAIDVWNGEHA